MHNKLASEHHIIVIESDWRPSWWNWLDCFCYSPVDTVKTAHVDISLNQSNKLSSTALSSHHSDGNNDIMCHS